MFRSMYLSENNVMDLLLFFQFRKREWKKEKIINTCEGWTNVVYTVIVICIMAHFFMFFQSYGHNNKAPGIVHCCSLTNYFIFFCQRLKNIAVFNIKVVPISEPFFSNKKLHWLSKSLKFNYIKFNSLKIYTRTA